MGGPASDHDPIVLKLEFKQNRRGIAPPKLLRMRKTWNKLDGQETVAEFQQVVMTNLESPQAKEYQ